MDASQLELQPILQKKYDDLLAKRDALPASETQMDRAIALELDELLHRLDLLENLRIMATTDQLKAAILAVRKSDEQLTGELQTITDAKRFLDSMSAYLGVVDQAIDLAKKLALA
jgi:hypothetical protein